MLSGDVLTVDHIHHVRYDVSDAYPKPRNLIYVLEMEEPDNAIVFCNTRDDTALVTAVLNRNGFDAELLNGDLPQKERERVMAKVKRGEVALHGGRPTSPPAGIDISDLEPRHQLLAARGPGGATCTGSAGPAASGRRALALNLVSGRGSWARSPRWRRSTASSSRSGRCRRPDEALRMWTERHVREIQRSASAGSVYEGFLGLAGSAEAALRTPTTLSPSSSSSSSGTSGWTSVRAAAEAGPGP